MKTVAAGLPGPVPGRGPSSVRRSAMPWLALLTVLVAAFACRKGAETPPVSPSAKRYPLTGEVKLVDPGEGRIDVAHDAIPGFMDPMTMSFAVRPPERIKELATGDRIAATLVVDKERSWLEGITVSFKGKALPSPPSRLVVLPKPAEPGDEVPPFSLVDQDGRTITRETFRGKALVVTFFFTHCPLPEFCPRMSENFGALEKALTADAKLGGRTRLLSVSFDPERDTPQVLRTYGLRFHAKESTPFAIWSLATGGAGEVKKLTDFFGVWFQNDGGNISHGLATSVVDPQGRVVRTFYGNSWTTDEVLDELHAIPESRSLR